MFYIKVIITNISFYYSKYRDFGVRLARDLEGRDMIQRVKNNFCVAQKFQAASVNSESRRRFVNAVGWVRA